MFARTWADPDLWGHLRFGADTLHIGLLRTDPYSFTSDITWINHEWLAEVVMYGAWAASGGVGLVLLKLACAAAVLTVIVRVLHRDAVTGTTRDLLVFAIIIGLWARLFVVRPQIFSLVLFATELWAIRMTERGTRRAIWVLPMVFALWVNLHGGWVAGLAVLLVWTALECSPFRRAEASRVTLLSAAAASIAATLVNPYGAHMWTFLWRTVGLQRPDINDWRPLADSGAAVIVPVLVSAAIAGVGIARGRRAVPPSSVAIVAVLAFATIRVNRLDAFFVLAVVALIGRFVEARRSPAQAAPLWTGGFRVAAASLAVVATAALFLFRSQLFCVRLDGPWMPERASGAFIAQNHLTGRLLTWFDWGQYAIWHFSPALRVSIDGRRETVYSDALVAGHLRLYFQPSTAAGMLSRLDPDYAWLPRDVPLVQALERGGWTRVFDGPISVVLSRRPITFTMPAPPSTPPCFPGP